MALLEIEQSAYSLSTLYRVIKNLSHLFSKSMVIVNQLMLLGGDS